jgi:hypothetical protein
VSLLRFAKAALLRIAFRLETILHKIYNYGEGRLGFKIAIATGQATDADKQPEIAPACISAELL